MEDLAENWAGIGDFVPPQLTREKTLFRGIDPRVVTSRRKKDLPKLEKPL